MSKVNQTKPDQSIKNARPNGKPDFFPSITKSGKIELLPVLQWNDLEHLNSSLSEMGQEWMSAKAIKLRLMAADLISQAREIEHEIQEISAKA